MVKYIVANDMRRVQFPLGARLVSIKVSMFGFQPNGMGAVPIQDTIICYYFVAQIK